MEESLINKLFAGNLLNTEEIEGRYPKRQLPPEAIVSRVAPSPTGFVHLGGLYAALISERFAHESKGVFILRIEDTDKKREVANTAELFAQSLNYYGLKADEGLQVNGQELGDYGPYRQSNRKEIYQSFAKKLVLEGKAYPCFASEKELADLREQQEKRGERSGYYGEYATWRNKSEKEILEALESGLQPVIRLKSSGDFNKKIIIKDLLLGSRELPENDQDIVLIKADGLPTYHFAHAIDDYLMGTTHVIRGNEWFPSLPLHLQLFEALGWQAPNYAHLSPIQKLEDDKKRKLSKRKDPEANLDYYKQAGYPQEAVVEYLLNLANSNFEDWRRNNPQVDNSEFSLSWKKLAKSNGPLFDLDKLENISKERISFLSADKVYERALAWSREYDQELEKLLIENPDYSKAILDIERSNVSKPRKDIAKWQDLKNEIIYFFDEHFQLPQDLIEKQEEILKDLDLNKVKNDFLDSYNSNDSQQECFAKIRSLAEKHGLASNVKEYKENPDKYKGQVGALAQYLRLLITGRLKSPDLCLIMKVMGEDRIKQRINKA